MDKGILTLDILGTSNSRHWLVISEFLLIVIIKTLYNLKI